MFQSNPINGSHTESPDELLKKLQFIIVYGKYFKKPSLRLYNIVASKYTCVLWNEEIYLKNEPKLTNKNKRIFLGGDMSEDYFEFDKNNAIQINRFVAFITQGPMASLYIQWDSDMEDEIPHESDDPWWKKYNPLYITYSSCFRILCKTTFIL